MGARKKVVTASPAARSRGRSRETASFPLAPLRAELPEGYAELLREIRQRIQWARLRTVMATKPAMVLLYGDIGSLAGPYFRNRPTVKRTKSLETSTPNANLG